MIIDLIYKSHFRSWLGLYICYTDTISVLGLNNKSGNTSCGTLVDAVQVVKCYDNAPKNYPWFPFIIMKSVQLSEEINYYQKHSTVKLHYIYLAGACWGIHFNVS